MKIKKPIRSLIVGSAVLAMTAFGATSPATAAPLAETDLIATAAAADVEGFVIVEPEDAVQVGESTFYPTGPISEETLVVIAEPDGTLPAGLTEELLSEVGPEGLDSLGGGMAARASYGWTGVVTRWTIAASKPSHIGINDAAKAPYSFSTNQSPGKVSATGHGLGYYRGYNGSTFGTWSAWYTVGTATTNAASKSVPWGNVAANRQFRAKCVIVAAPSCGGGWS